MECLNLNVSEAQNAFVASNMFSLAQAWVYYETAYPFAIYSDDIMVGFIMLGYYEKKSIYNIWRFMIDEKYQRKGYGKAALLLAVKYLEEEFKIKKIYLSFVHNNYIAEKLYSSCGFVKTGKKENDEIEMCLEL